MELLTIRADLFEKISKLNLQQQQQLLEVVDTMLGAEQNGQTFDFDAWLADARAFRERLRAHYGPNHFFNSVDILNEIREERLNDLMGGH